MVTTLELVNDRLYVNIDYYYLGRIRKIPGASFDPALKVWTLPVGSLQLFEREFEGEFFYKTPRWQILNEPMPDMSAMYRLRDVSIKAPDMKITLYDYQRFGARFMIDRMNAHGFCINADGVGLGKTAQAIACIKHFHEQKLLERFLLIVKKSVKSQWVSEFDKFTDMSQDFTIVRTGDTPASRKKAYEECRMSPKCVLVTNYHNFLTDAADIDQLGFQMAVIDEVHCLATRTGKMNNNVTKVIAGLPTLFLTGTPIMNDPENMFAIIQMADQRYFGSWNEFSKEFLVRSSSPYGGFKTVGVRNADRLRYLVQDVIIRRTEKEVTVALPSVIVHEVSCPRDATQKRLMEEIQKLSTEITGTLDELSKKTSLAPKQVEEKERLEGQLKGLIAAKQAVATDPRMFFETPSAYMKKNFGSLVPKNYKGSSKMEALVDLVQTILDNNEKVLIFSKFATSAYLAAKEIQGKLKVNVLMYTGAEGQDERDNNIWWFWNSNQYNVFIGTEALSEGVNAQCARFVVNIDQPDTSSTKTQRIGRVRRVGSNHQSVMVYDLITEDSKDVERLENIKNTEALSSGLVDIDEAQSRALVEAMKGG